MEYVIFQHCVLVATQCSNVQVPLLLLCLLLYNVGKYNVAQHCIYVVCLLGDSYTILHYEYKMISQHWLGFPILMVIDVRLMTVAHCHVLP